MQLLNPELKDCLGEDSLIRDVQELEGEVYRDVAGRRTFRFEHGGRGYFAKVHQGVGWREIIKNLLQLKQPVLGAENEYQAVRRLGALGIPTLEPVAFASEGWNPATRQSCLVTREIAQAPSLEDLALAGEITPALRRRLVREVARLTALMHNNGVNHRDLYICHFLVRQPVADPPRLFLIDLHRAQLRPGRAPRRWRQKDLAALLFSAVDAGLSRRDLVLFVRCYIGGRARPSLEGEHRFWRAVVRRAQRLYQKDHEKTSPFLDALLGATA